MRRAIQNCGQGVLDVLYPPVCPFCRTVSPEGICQKCSRKIVYIKSPACMRCGKPLESDRTEFCLDCLRKKGSCIRQGCALWLHREPVSEALYNFKYKNKRSWGRIFALELAENYGSRLKKWDIDQIIPIPLHPSREKKRGFNQALLIGEELGKITGIECHRDVLFRIRKTIPQKCLDPGERRENLRGAFAVSRRWQPVDNILLVDDIYTTGATLEKAAKMLRKAGARNIYFLTLSIGQGI